MSASPTIRTNEPERESIPSGLQQGASPQGDVAEESPEAVSNYQNKKQLNQSQLLAEDHHKVFQPKVKTHKIIQDFSQVISLLRSFDYQTSFESQQSPENDVLPLENKRNYLMDNQEVQMVNEMHLTYQQIGFDKNSIDADIKPANSVNTAQLQNSCFIGRKDSADVIKVQNQEQNIDQTNQNSYLNSNGRYYTNQLVQDTPQNLAQVNGQALQIEPSIIQTNEEATKVQEEEKNKEGQFSHELNGRIEFIQQNQIPSEERVVHPSMLLSNSGVDHVNGKPDRQEQNTFLDKEAECDNIQTTESNHEKKGRPIIAQMKRKYRFDQIDQTQDALNCQLDEESMTYVSFQIPVAGRLVSDGFLWPCSVRDVHQIKLFAVSLLADLFGKSFSQLDPREIEYFCIHLVYIIEREVELCLHPTGNFRALVMDGQLGAGIGVSALAPRNKSQIGEGVAEHIFKIEIDEVLVEDDAYLQVQESFEWDLSNPDNSPDEVANQLIGDLMLEQGIHHDIERYHKVFASQLSLQIRNKIQMYVTRTANAFRQNAKMLLSTSDFSEMLNTADTKLSGIDSRIDPSEALYFGGGTKFQDQLPQVKKLDRRVTRMRKREAKTDEKTFASEQKIMDTFQGKISKSDATFWSGMALRNKRFQPRPIIIKPMFCLTQTHLQLPPEIQEEQESPNKVIEELNAIADEGKSSEESNQSKEEQDEEGQRSENGINNIQAPVSSFGFAAPEPEQQNEQENSAEKIDAPEGQNQASNDIDMKNDENDELKKDIVSQPSENEEKVESPIDVQIKKPSQPIEFHEMHNLDQGEHLQCNGDVNDKILPPALADQNNTN